MAHNLSSTVIVVTWHPPVTPNGIIESYLVEFKCVSDFNSSTNCVDQESSGSGSGNASGDGVVNKTYTNSTSVIITMLQNYTTYKVQVFAFTNVIGEGSEIVNVTTDSESELLYVYVHLYKMYVHNLFPL